MAHVGDLVARMLQAYGVEFVFGMPGGQTTALHDGIRKLAPAIRHVLVRDERSAPYAADAYARLTGKPGTAEAARRQWHSMAGREGRLFTGHCVIRVRDGAPVATETAAAITTVRFGIPTESELDAYIATGEPLGVAGAFTLDGLGGWFLDGIDGDPTNVIGLGLAVTRRLLESVGCSIGELWRTNPR